MGALSVSASAESPQLCTCSPFRPLQIVSVDVFFLVVCARCRCSVNTSCPLIVDSSRGLIDSAATGSPAREVSPQNELYAFSGMLWSRTNCTETAACSRLNVSLQTFDFDFCFVFVQVVVCAEKWIVVFLFLVVAPDTTGTKLNQMSSSRLWQKAYPRTVCASVSRIKRYKHT